jgi:hypothetical protein
MNKRIIPLLSVLFLLMVATVPLHAATPCTIVYGGGLEENGSPYCMEALSNTIPSPTVTPKKTLGSTMPSYIGTQTGSTGSPQTKGGLPVQSPSAMNNQPNTGPESLALLAIPSFGALGWLLRKKAA